MNEWLKELAKRSGSVLGLSQSSLRVDPEVRSYVEATLSNITISIDRLSRVPAMQMSDDGELMGFCSQSSTFLSVFFKDDDIVSRGTTILDVRENYYHSWIEFKYKDREYVLDAAFNILCDRNFYYKVFEPNQVTRIKANTIKMALMSLISAKPNGLINIQGSRDIDNPFYHADDSMICGEIDDGRVKKIGVCF